MESLYGSASRESDNDSVTARVVRRFITAFRERDPVLIPDLVGERCVMEGMQPAPDGLRVEGYADNVSFWQAMVRDTSGTFEQEDLVILGDRAINRWRYRSGDGVSVRGVTLLRVEDGKIVEALGYAKTPAARLRTRRRSSAATTTCSSGTIPAALPEIVSADCVIENTTPAPDGARYVGRDACVGLWSGIATAPGTRFDIEDVAVAGERATIRWRLFWGERGEHSVRGVNLMRVQQGQITEALGYVKAVPAPPARTRGARDEIRPSNGVPADQESSGIAHLLHRPRIRGGGRAGGRWPARAAAVRDQRRFAGDADPDGRLRLGDRRSQTIAPAARMSV